MKQLFFIALTFALFEGSCASQEIKVRLSFSAIMDTTQASIILRQCSRSTPKNIGGYWMPSQREIDSLETNLNKIQKVPSIECCNSGAKISTSYDYALQYFGVTIKEKKFIYINAFPAKSIKDNKQFGFDPNTMPLITCDGGSRYWGALFDPQTMEFSLLAFNGNI